MGVVGETPGDVAAQRRLPEGHMERVRGKQANWRQERGRKFGVTAVSPAETGGGEAVSPLQLLLSLLSSPLPFPLLPLFLPACPSPVATPKSSSSEKASLTTFMQSPIIFIP